MHYLNHGFNAMTSKSTAPFNIAPELVILDTLPDNLRKRFKVALKLMHENLFDSLSWEMVAKKSAISPFHFHRQFSELFQETPGRYLSRVRLQHAVHLLLTEPQKRVTDIAHLCGYSSSQVLAKVLKRELGVSANELRPAGSNSTPLQTFKHLEKLAHPRHGDSFEKHLAKSMPAELVWYAKRGVKVIEVPDFDWDKAYSQFGDKSLQLLTLTPIGDIDRCWDEIAMMIADWNAPIQDQNESVAEGYYLCCEVFVLNDTGYVTAIESLFERARGLGFKVDTSKAWSR